MLIYDLLTYTIDQQEPETGPKAKTWAESQKMEKIPRR